MTKTMLFLTMLLVTAVYPLKAAWSKTLTIAVIDSGIDGSLPNLCKFGHKSFVKTLPNPLVDENGHGTHVAGLINSTAGIGNYCIVAIKFYDPSATGWANLGSILKAVQYAINIKVDFINISGGGPEFNLKERNLILKALNNKITVVTAAGNENDDLDKECNYFPACYDPRIIMVGNLRTTSLIESWSANGLEIASVNVRVRSTERTPSSNYGNRVTRWEIGTNVLSTLPGGRMGRMTGTSQATAIATGKLVRERLSR